MELPDSLKLKEISLSLNSFERRAMSVLVVEPDSNDRNNLRQAIKEMQLGYYTDVPTHAAAIEKFQERRITHVIFDAKKTNYPPMGFLQKLLELDPNVVAIPSSYHPNVDDVFDLLMAGARGYLVKPFTADTVELSMVMATKGEPMSESVLQAKDRNEALISILMGSVDKAALLLRQAMQFETARREVPRAFSSMKRSADLARMFCKGGEPGLLEALEKFCIERSKGPATRLGRLRKRLQTKRELDEEDGGQTASSNGA